MNMKPLLLFLLAFVGVADPSPAATTIASTSASKAAADGGRFLFVVKTTSSMRRIETASRQAVFDMIFTGLHGYMRSGDSFGLWTFNEQTQAGDFPMQVWDAQSPMDPATRAASHLRAQRYSGDSDTSELILKLQSVIGAVRNVTIFIVTDASTQFEGTSFDEAINSTIQRQAKEQTRAKKPFITTLVARDGNVTSAFVTLAGQAITLPERPSPPLVQKSTPPADPKAAPAPVPQRGKIIEFVAKTNPPTPVTGSNSLAPGVDTVKTPSVPQPELVVTQHTALIITNTPKATNEAVASAVAKVEPPALTPLPAATLVYASEAEPAPKPVTPAPTALMPRPRMSVSAREFKPQPIEAQIPVEPLNASMQPMQATAVMPLPGLSPMVMLIIGGLLLASALFLIAVVLRRLRPASQPSFISQSMDRR